MSEGQAMNPEYYALTLQNGETLTPSAKELERVFRDNLKAARSMGGPMPPAWRRFLRASAAATLPKAAPEPATASAAAPLPRTRRRPARPPRPPAERRKVSAERKLLPAERADYVAFLESLPRRRRAAA
jgi:hypothetical protein